MNHSYVAVAALLALLSVVSAHADTVRARCDIFPKGEDRASASLLCDFSQRQGFVSIQRADGVRYELRPSDDTAGNYQDAQGRAAYRQSGLGSEGLIFRLADESVFVYWDASALDAGQSDADSPTAPYSTADYDATTVLPCSFGSAAHDQSCPAGILRAAVGSASIRILKPDGEERVLNFDGDRVGTPGAAKLSFSHDSGEWTISIDGSEFFRVPDAAVSGG